MHEPTTANRSESTNYLTIPEAAVRLGVSSDTIRRRIRTGELRAHLFARKYRIASTDLDALVRGEAAA